MLRITIQDLHNNSPRCMPECSRYKEEGCVGGCTLRFRVIFNCPNCKVVKCFYGGNSPQTCDYCFSSLPDIYTIKTDGGADIRVKYHLEENK
jgi:hypothetical protein